MASLIRFLKKERVSFPSSVMDRGYAVVRQGERVVSRTSGVDGSVPLRVCFSDGELTADVTAITAKDEAR